ncbi:MAG: hypothetical protein K6U14_06935 [Firmicutes bacterium]|nr:hypothetical protein [Alicyclobacillaceae bacterium]MCL6497354.1 hypothetical protein [Bacillota bacterium]
MDAQSFIEALVRARDARHAQDHPLVREWACGRLTRLEVAHVVLQHVRWSQEVATLLGVLQALAADPAVQHHCVLRLAQWHGLKADVPEEEAHSDWERQMRFIESCGVRREEAERIPITAGARALADYHWSLAFRRPWQVAAAAVWASTSQEVGVLRRVLPGLIHYYGYQPGCEAIRFFEERSLADPVDPAHTLPVLAEHVLEPVLFTECLEAVKMATGIQWLFWTELYRWVEAKGAVGRAG